MTKIEKEKFISLLVELEEMIWMVAHGSPFEKGKFYDWIHIKARPLMESEHLVEATAWGSLGGR